MYCKQCGNEIQIGNRFCENCGQPVGVGYLHYPVYHAGSFRSLFFRYSIVLIVLTSDFVLNEVLSTIFTLHEGTKAILALPQIILSITVVCYWAYLLYRSWAIIQDGGRAATTPGLAVGLNFIPFFNCYWAFVSQLGLAKCMNTYCCQRNINAPIVSENIAFINSCMTTVWMVWGIMQVLIAGVHGIEKQGALLPNPPFVFFINVCLWLIWLALEYLLYNQYAHVAEAIQNYKRFQDSPTEGQ